jgi:toxin ParE1/3/4
VRLYWTEEALKKLREIKLYIAADNPKAAEILIEEIFKKAEQLTSFPEMGKIVAEFPEKNLRELIHKRYRIVYQIKDKYCFVLTVFESHRLFPKK